MHVTIQVAGPGDLIADEYPAVTGPRLVQFLRVKARVDPSRREKAVQEGRPATENDVISLALEDVASASRCSSTDLFRFLSSAAGETTNPISSLPGQDDSGNTNVTSPRFETKRSLPSKVTGVQVGISKGTDGQITHVNVSITHQVPIVAWSLLAIGTLVGAMWTPMAVLETGVSSPVKCVWKSIMEMVAFTPLFVYSVYTEGLDRPGLAKVLWMISAGVTNGGSNLVLFWAIEHTSMTHAVLLSSTSSIVLAIGRPMLGLGYPKSVEAVGIIIAIIGGYVCTRDDPQHQGGHPGALADALCLFAAVLNALNLVSAKYLWDDFKLWQYVFWQQLGSLTLYLFFAAITRIATLDMDRQTGLFGCLNFTPDRLLINIGGGPACALFGTAALIATLKYLDPVLISVASILQPLLSTLFGFLLGVSSFPKPLALLGGLVMSAGTGLVVYATGGEETEVIGVPIKDDRVDKSNISSENKAPSASWKSVLKWKKGARVMVFGKEQDAPGEQASLLSNRDS